MAPYGQPYGGRPSPLGIKGGGKGDPHAAKQLAAGPLRLSIMTKFLRVFISDFLSCFKDLWDFYDPKDEKD